MVRHQCYDTNHFITLKCICYLTFIVPNLIIKYDSLPCCSLSYFFLPKDSTSARTQKALLLVTKQLTLLCANRNLLLWRNTLFHSFMTCIYRTKRPSIWKASPPLHPLSHHLGIHPLTPIWTLRNVAHLDSTTVSLVIRYCSFPKVLEASVCLRYKRY